MQTQNKNNFKVIEKIDMTGVTNVMFNKMYTMTGNDDYKKSLKYAGALPDCTSATTNDKFCLCTMNSVRNGLPAKSQGSNYVCDNLDMQ